MKYIAKPNTWYKAGTEVTVEEILYDGVALCRGVRVCENPDSEGKHHYVGEEYNDGEICMLDEFEVIL